LATAQVIASSSATVNGTLGTNSDEDFFRITVGAGKTLTARLSTGKTSGFGLTALTGTGQTLASLSAVLGQTSQIAIQNRGSANMQITLRVMRSTGATGAYTLALTQ
jgi:serine protease